MSTQPSLKDILDAVERLDAKVDSLHREVKTKVGQGEVPSPLYVTWKGSKYTSIHHISCHNVGRRQGRNWRSDDKYVVHPNLVEAVKHAQRDTTGTFRSVKTCECMRGELAQLLDDLHKTMTT